MRSQPREPFIKIPDRLITEGDEIHLTEIELYLYSLLSRKRNYEGVTETSIAFLYETSPIEFGSSRQRNIDIIKNTLLSLVDKKVIRIHNGKRELLNNFKLINDDGEIIKEYKPSDLIIIVFGDSTTKGHTEVGYSKFDSFTSMSDYYIFLATLRWINSSNGTFYCSYERWRKILQVSEKTARTKVDEAVKKKVIYKNIGNYRNDEMIGNQKKQDKNAYRTTPFKEVEKTIITKRFEAKTDFQNVANLF